MIIDILSSINISESLLYIIYSKSIYNHSAFIFFYTINFFAMTLFNVDKNLIKKDLLPLIAI